MAIASNTRAQPAAVSASHMSLHDQLTHAEAELSQLREQREQLDEEIHKSEDEVRRLQDETMTKAQLVARDQAAAYALLQAHEGDWLQAKDILTRISSDYKTKDVLDPLVDKPGIERKTKPGIRFRYTTPAS